MKVLCLKLYVCKTYKLRFEKSKLCILLNNEYDIKIDMIDKYSNFKLK